MAFDIAVPSIDDAVAITDTQVRAMDSNELLHAKFPDLECWSFVREWFHKDNLDHINDGRDKGILAARDPETGRIASFVKWLVQRHGEPAGDLPDEEQWPATCRTQYLDTYTAITREARRELMGTKPFYHVTFICTDPEWSGRGAASRLLRQVLARAREDDVPVILESTMPAVAFYQKLGFRILRGLEMMIPPEESNEPTERYSEQVMIWSTKTIE